MRLSLIDANINTEHWISKTKLLHSLLLVRKLYTNQTEKVRIPLARYATYSASKISMIFPYSLDVSKYTLQALRILGGVASLSSCELVNLLTYHLQAYPHVSYGLHIDDIKNLILYTNSTRG